jgi:hypothetical protein
MFEKYEPPDLKNGKPRDPTRDGCRIKEFIKRK